MTGHRTSRDAPTSALYVCYLSLDDPLAWTQVVAYLAGLVRRGHRIHLLSWEPKSLPAARRRQIRAELDRRGISWHALRYHKRPSLPATIYDVMRGVAVAAFLAVRHRLHVLHARSHVPAACVLPTCRLLGRPLVFDIRGLMAEEFVDAGRWRAGGLPFRITKRVERLAIRRADQIVVLTRRVRAHLFAADDARVHVIPCCADLGAIEAQRERRADVRGALGINDRTVMVYVGKFTGWYLEAEMARFFQTARRSRPDLHFLIVTQSDFALIVDELDRQGVEDSAYTITRVPPEEIGSYLAAADFGISFIQPAPSKASSSPTKIGEYLGAGLPILCGRGVGDVDDLLDRYHAGALVDRFFADAYGQAIDQVGALLDDPGTPERCRKAARAELSLEEVGIPAYDRVYRAAAGAS